MSNPRFGKLRIRRHRDSSEDRLSARQSGGLTVCEAQVGKAVSCRGPSSIMLLIERNQPNPVGQCVRIATNQFASLVSLKKMPVFKFIWIARLSIRRWLAESERQAPQLYSHSSCARSDSAFNASFGRARVTVASGAFLDLCEGAAGRSPTIHAHSARRAARVSRCSSNLLAVHRADVRRLTRMPSNAYVSNPAEAMHLQSDNKKPAAPMVCLQLSR
jgi:hypothetical protein